MSGWVVEVHALPDRREAVAAWLVGATGQSVEERADGWVVGFLETSEGVSLVRQELGDRFGSDVQVSAHPAPVVDWSTQWRHGLAPREIGRLTVTPTWLPITPQSGRVTLVIDPEMAFGTGEHGSTRAALRLLERLLRPGDRVLDVGSGSGILAIASVLLGAQDAIGIEIDEEAIPVAEGNADRNGVGGAVRFLTGDAAELAVLAGPADLVLSNILRTVNVVLLPAIEAALKPGGLVIFAGMECPEAPLFRQVLAEAGWLGLEEVEDEGWWAIAARRP